MERCRSVLGEAHRGKNGRCDEPEAKTLRAFHERGFVHTHPHFNQFSQGPADEIVIHDFTNVQAVARLSRDEFIFRIFNDLHAMMRNIAALAAILDKPLVLALEPTDFTLDHYLMGGFVRSYLGQSSSWSEKEIYNAADPSIVFKTVDQIKKDTGYNGQRPADFNLSLMRIVEVLGGAIYHRPRRLAEAA